MPRGKDDGDGRPKIGTQWAFKVGSWGQAAGRNPFPPGGQISTKRFHPYNDTVYLPASTRPS